MIPRLADIEHGIKGRRLAGRGQHRRCTAFQLTDLCRHVIAGGVLQSGIEIAGCFQIEQLSHLLTGIILKCGALHNGDEPTFPVFGRIARLNTFCFDV